jgi:very-short-patch-repair endonuclease
MRSLFSNNSDGFLVLLRLRQMEYSKPIAYVRAKRMRGAPTDAEQKLWGALRGRRLGGLKFYRQVPVGPYIVDFICHEYGVVVEVDGATHSEDAAIKYDLQRNSYLEALGLFVHHVWSSEIYAHFEDAVGGIFAVVKAQEKKERRAMKWLPGRG